MGLASTLRKIFNQVDVLLMARMLDIVCVMSKKKCVFCGLVLSCLALSHACHGSHTPGHESGKARGVTNQPRLIACDTEPADIEGILRNLDHDRSWLTAHINAVKEGLRSGETGPPGRWAIGRGEPILPVEHAEALIAAMNLHMPGEKGFQITNKVLAPDFLKDKQSLWQAVHDSINLWCHIYSQAEGVKYFYFKIEFYLSEDGLPIFTGSNSSTSLNFHQDSEPRIANATYFVPNGKPQLDPQIWGTEVLEVPEESIVSEYKDLRVVYSSDGSFRFDATTPCSEQETCVYAVPLGHSFYFSGDQRTYDAKYGRVPTVTIQGHRLMNYPATPHRTPHRKWQGSRLVFVGNFAPDEASCELSK